MAYSKSFCNRKRDIDEYTSENSPLFLKNAQAVKLGFWYKDNEN